jgi:hypothetical protein
MLLSRRNGELAPRFLLPLDLFRTPGSTCKKVIGSIAGYYPPSPNLEKQFKNADGIGTKA